MIFLSLALSIFGLTGNQYDSVRTLGQGSAAVSSIGGFDAALLNPAGLAHYKALLGEVLVLSPQALVSPTIFENYKYIKSNYKNFNVQNLISLANKYQKINFYADAQNLTGLFFKNVGLSFLTKATARAYLEADINNPTQTNLLLDATAYEGGVLSFYHSFLNDQIKIGFNGKILQKTESTVSIIGSNVISNNQDIKSLLKNVMSRGQGTGFDIGAQVAFDKNHVFELGGVIKNILMNYPGNIENYPSPSRDLTTADLGMSANLRSSKSQLKVSFDYTDVTDSLDEPTFKHINAGAELNFDNFIGVTGGFHHGAIAFGAFLNLKFVRFELSQDSFELGSYPGSNPVLRYGARISAGYLW